MLPDEGGMDEKTLRKIIREELATIAPLPEMLKPEEMAKALKVETQTLAE
jgi:hypothetical protein